MMMKKLFLVLLMVALALPFAGAWAVELADEALPYAEKIIAVPDGYEPITSMAMGPDGTVYAAAKHTSGAWHLLSWRDLTVPPVITAIAYNGEDDIAKISVAPDGQIMAVIPDYSVMRNMMSSLGVDSAAASSSVDRLEQAAGAPVGNAGTPSGGGGPAGQPAGIVGTPARGGTMSFGGGAMTMGGFGLGATVLWLSPDGSVAASFEASTSQSLTIALSGRRMAASDYFQRGNTFVIYDDAGKEARQIDVGDVQAMAASNTDLYVLNTDGIHAYSLDDGQKKFFIPIQLGYGGIAALGEDGSLFFTDMDGVNRVDFGAQRVSRVMTLTGTLLGDPGNSVSAFAVRADGTIIGLTTNSGMTTISGGGYAVRGIMAFGGRGGIGGSEVENTLSYYVPMDPAIAANRAAFTITTLYNSTTLRKAVSDFQREHPELEVTLQAQIGDGDESPLEDHIRTLNTDLLAGRGGDVLILDGLPMDKYIQRGVLKDIGALSQRLGLLPNIVEGSADASGKVYAVPARFSFETLWGHADLLGMITCLEDIAYASLEPGQSPLAGRTPEDWVRLLYPVCETALRDAKGQLHFDTQAFELFLEILYDLYTRQGELSTLDVTRRFGRAAGRMNMTELLAVYNGAAAFFPSSVDNLMQLSTAYTVSGGENGAFFTLPSLYGPGDTYTPTLIAGINARSPHQALAEDFVTLLLSPEVQEVDQMSGLPTTTAALDKLFDDAIERTTIGISRVRMMIPGGVSLDISEPTEAVWKAMRTLCETVTSPVTVDETLMAFILEETGNFFDGKISAAAAGSALERRAWFYLNE